MTLKEIYKIIDEADFYLKNEDDDISSLNHPYARESVKHGLGFDIKMGSKYVFYKFNKETGDITLLAKIDHIDKERKTIKKKLSEMTEEEIKQVMDRFCDADDSNDCADSDCPFAYGKKCLASFPFWKKLYEDNKDKEFDVEVEE